MSKILDAFKIYFHPRILTMALLGMTCGIPLILTGSTLSIWLTEIGVDKTKIGLIGMVAIPYSLKFLWAPIIDFITLPYLGNQLGRRKSWLVLSQFFLIISILVMGFSKPEHRLFFTAFMAIVLSFFSASQDIVVDAYRLELLPKKEQAPGIAAYIIGYRIGMLFSSAGALFMAEFFEWSTVYSMMAVIVFIGMTCAFFIEEPDIGIKPLFFSSNVFMRRKEKSVMIILRRTVIAPFKDFIKKQHWYLILIFVVLYKLGDSFAGHMANPFFIELGFSKTEIATIVKSYGLLATLAGSAIGGSIVYKYGINRGLIFCAIIQATSNLFYILQEYVGYDPLILGLTVSAENLAGGIGAAAFLAYLGRLCNNPQFTATQYALLSSIASLGRTFISSSSGYIVDNLGWTFLFVISAIMAIPAIFIFMYITKSKVEE